MIKRLTKGSPLIHEEMDANFTEVHTKAIADKID